MVGVTTMEILLAGLVLWCACAAVISVGVGRLIARGAEITELEHLFALSEHPRL
jgi:hypothetical protein